MRVGLAATLGASLFGATVAWAAGPKLIGTFSSWTAYVVEDDQGKHCFVYSEPTEAKGKYTRRGKVSVSVSHRPKAKVRNEISFSAGYDYKPESEVELAIDGSKRFTLFVDGGTAWAPDGKVDSEIRRAIEKGSKMTITGQSKRGTRTTDTYSLSGTTAALKQIDRECGA